MHLLQLRDPKQLWETKSSAERIAPSLCNKAIQQISLWNLCLCIETVASLLFGFTFGKLKPGQQCMAWATITFLHNHAQRHTAKTTMEWLRDMSQTAVVWPCQSQDLKCIEHLWRDVCNTIKCARSWGVTKGYQIIRWGIPYSLSCSFSIYRILRRKHSILGTIHGLQQ